MSIQVPMSIEEVIINRLEKYKQGRKEHFSTWANRVFQDLREVIKPLYEEIKTHNEARKQAERDLGNAIDQRNILANALIKIVKQKSYICSKTEGGNHASCCNDGLCSYILACDGLKEAGYELP